MTNKKLEYVEMLFDKGFLLDDSVESPNLNFAIHSILNTIDLTELIDLYVSLQKPKIKNQIESNLSKRLEKSNNLDTFYEKIFRILSGAEYQQRQRIRKLLLIILPYLDPVYSKEFFNTFYYSDFVHDKSAALSVSGRIWEDSFNEQILGDYLENKREVFLRTYLNHGDINYCLKYLKNIWANEPSNYLKTDIIRRLSEKHIDDFYFLRETEPEKYLFAVSLSEREFEDEEIRNIYNDIPFYLKPYGLLSLSKLNKWDIIEVEINTFANMV